MLKVNRLSVRYGALTIVDGLSFSVSEGQWLMIVGPNGAGKSTTLNAVAQSVSYEGDVLLCGADVGRMKPAERARKIGVLTQTHFVGYSYTVEEVVSLGRYAYAKGPFAGRDDADEAAVEEA